MKLNSYRLVQRKFALGVPIPASTSSVAPPPAERKADPPHPPRSVYHNNMPAKNLLDVVAMQNIHKHKQPMVLLERLREDEIPAPPAPPKIRVPPRKRRNGLRVDKNNMCLRSGKRKSPEAGKGSVKKRRKLLSESTDDIPLVYFSRPNDGKAQSQANKAKDRSATKAKVKRFPPPKRGVRLETVTRRGSDRSAKNSSTDCNEDSSFTFKEPTSRARSYRILKRTTRTNPVVAARPLRKLDSRRSGLRSSTPVAKGIVRRLRDKRLSEKKLPKPVLSIVIEKPVVKEERAPSLCKEHPPSLREEHTPSLREEHPPSLREEHPPSLRKEHPPSLRKENPPSLREEHPPSIRKEHPPSLRKEHPPSLRKEHQPSLRKENPPSLREEHPPSIRKEHPPSWRKEHPPSLRKEHQPSLREKHPPSLREEHPPSIRKEHPPSLRKEHPPSLRKEHPPSLREKHPPSLREEHPPSLREDHPPSLREEHPPSLLKELPPSLLKELPSAPQPGTSSSSWPPLARQTPPASESGSSLRESLRLSPAGPSLLESPASDATNAEDSKFRVSVMNSIVEIPSPCTLACFDPKNSAKCDGCRQNKLESNEDWCINTSEVPEPSEGTTEAEKHMEQPANTQHETNQQHNEATNDTLPREEYSMLINTHEDSVLQLRAIVSALGCTTVPQDSSPENKHGPPERAEKDLEKNKGENRAADNNKVGGKNKVGKKNKVGEKRISEAQKKVENGPKQKKARKPATKSVAGPKKAKRGSKTSTQDTSNSVSTTVSDAQPPPVPANPDVYEFNAELETTRPPSGLRGRLRPRKPPSTSNQTTEHPEPQANLDTSQLDKDALLKVFGDKTHRIHITPKKPEEVGPGCLSVSIVRKETCSQTDAETTQSLVEKFLSSLSIQIQNELENFIVSERAQNTTANEPQPSTSRQANQARSNTNQSVNNADDQVASTSRQEPANETIKIESGVATYECPSTYLDQKTGLVMDAPTFYPTADEFADPIKYYDKIAPLASAYGLCKIVPPEGFKPPCNMSETTRFAVMYQYISKMYNRWGPVSRELAAIKAHLRSQSVLFARSPLLDGSEVNLPRLYHAVERFGGLTNVMRRNRWGRVAEEMKLSKLQYPERKLDPIYMRYLLPYATLSDQERQKLMAQVESCWTTKYQKMLDRARNPFQRQHRMLGTECESESDDENFDRNTTGALFEAEDCIVQGRNMNLATFKKIATSLMDAHFEPSKQPPSPEEVEKAYWRAVFLGTEHIVANTASVDTGDEGYGFPIDPEDEYGTHPWNLKFLARNPENVLRYLGRVLGVTVPTLHVSMVFSTSCWHRDPHGLPWTEYMHSGAEKIWYGIPRGESSNFRRAVETLCPAYCQNKSIWLASEITMVPPNILSAHGVKLSRLLQKPGEYVLVFPEAHTCSISTGVSISESVYFASNVWLSSVYKLFQELRNSCEPTMFSLEQLLLNGSQDPAAPQLVASVLATLLGSELEHRRALEARGVRVQERPPVNTPLNTSYFRTWDARDQDECEYCRSPLYLSKVTGFTGKKSAVCPEHAIRLLETKKHRHVDVSTLEIVSSHSTAALEEMLEWLETKNGPETRDSNVSPDQCIDLTGPDPPK